MKRLLRIGGAAAVAGALIAPVVNAGPASAYTVIRDVQYEQFTPVGGGSDWLTLDVYTPDTPPPTGGYPVVVAIHGARDSGDKNSVTAEATIFAAAGYLVIAPNYQLGCDVANPPPGIDPLLCGFDSPIPIGDLEYLTGTWLPADLATYQGNVNKVGTFGTSAGANYSFLLASLDDGHTKPVVAESLSGELRMYQYPLSPQPDAVGPKDINYIGCHYGQGDPNCDAKWYAASPYDQVSSGDSPIYFSNGRYEVIPWQPALDTANALSSASVPYFFRGVPGDAHGSASEPVVVGPGGTTVMDEAVQFMDTYLKAGALADLALTGSATPANVSVGAPLTYSLSVTNNGPQTAVDVTLTDVLPSGVTLSSATPSQGSCSGTTTITCSLGDIPSPSGATVSVVVTPTMVKTLANTPSVSESGPATDPTSANNSVSFSTTSVSQVNSDIRTSITDSPDPLVAGSNLTYTVSAKNYGPNSVNGVTATDALPNGATLVSATPSQGSCTGTTTVSCALGTLANKVAATVTIVATLNEPSTSTADTASVVGNAVDSNTSNNSATTTTKVTNAPNTVYVSAIDTGYSPASAKATEGQTVQWNVPVSDTWGHSATEFDGFTTPLFDSSTVYPGGYFRFQFFAAGSYTIQDTVTELTGTVKVGMTATPSTGSTITTFTITWASQTAPSGYLYDVQIKRPGSSAWSNWKTKYAPGNATFVADGGTGKYQFRARLRVSPGNTTTGWSSAKSITVS